MVMVIVRLFLGENHRLRARVKAPLQTRPVTPLDCSASSLHL
jgi:hypothetical protein